MYNSLFFSIVTDLCNNHNCLISEHFINPPKNTVPISSHFLFPLHQPLSISNVCVCVCVCVDLPILDISYKQITYYVISWLVSFTWHVSEVHLCCVCMLSHFSHVQLFATQWPIARQAPLSIGFSRQEYWSRLPCPSPGHLCCSI